MRTLIKLCTILIFIVLFSCENEDLSKGTLVLSLTDAPIDASNVSGVYLTVTEIKIHIDGNDWMVFEGFEGPKTYNILELTDGSSALLGSSLLEAGHYTQLRFYVDAPVRGTGIPDDLASYVQLTNGSKYPLFLPSGSNSGWKAIGEFSVPVNGEVSVTADFDARKSILEQLAKNLYILKPTFRLIVDNQAGNIVGTLSNVPENTDIVIYAYEDGSYDESEAEIPIFETDALFPNAVTSDIADEDASYNLSFLAPITYDLIVTTSIDGEFQEVIGTVEDVVVEAKSTTNQPINLLSL